ncbi:COP9 signalosome complex subunit 6 isoform X1 [Sitodiplosis mosellana]|uniref:COP9 signalosome complex subunit 6 isoform X1 n=2 Tax=Sitodiplosis mosellana TaxID=263140 RepID=UPI00244471CF|nr:COP9 signalosome complex subunit 6 isoform X1 [Sitodiplosis mosellana]
MPVTATNENMDVDSDNNIGEASTSNSATNTTPSTSNLPASSSSSNAATTTKQCTESSGNSVMASPATVPSVTVSLHPLVIMNISEHWTRIRAQNGSPQQVLGALIGKQSGRNVEVMNSFELKFKFVNQDIIIDQDYYRTKEEQYKQVFKDLDFLGWYTTGNRPTELDIKVHKQICEINECPIMLQLSPQSRNFDQLPVKIFESVIDIVQGEATMLFVNLTYTLATEEAERIGVDHVVRTSTHENGGKSAVAEHLIAQHSAIKMLHSRVKLILAYIKAIEGGTLPANSEILREAYALSQRLPVIQSSTFKEEYYTQSNDVGLITFLGTLTKGCNDINHFVNKFNVLYDRQGRGRMRGLFF